jgi:hypothetical protein
MVMSTSFSYGRNGSDMVWPVLWAVGAYSD